MPMCQTFEYAVKSFLTSAHFLHMSYIGGPLASEGHRAHPGLCPLQVELCVGDSLDLWQV